jgi:thymidylate synthase ThyX
MMKVEFIQGSIANDVKITTLVLEYPRSIHAQLLTHRVFSKNSSSSRAVPIKAAIEQIDNNPAQFIWTENQSGMSGKGIDDSFKLTLIHDAVTNLWNQVKQTVLYLGSKESEGGLNVHKQNAARFLEPFQNIRVVLTSTEWENWDWLRVDSAAQPEIAQLAKLMLEARTNNKYMQLAEGEWHVPFIKREVDPDTAEIVYRHPETDAVLTVKEAIELSMSICAQTSFRKEDYSDEKTESVIDKLFTGNKVHASPSEHQATPIPKFTDYGDNNNEWPEGVTHIDRKHQYWSGNFRGWIQNRQLIPNHDKAKF